MDVTLHLGAHRTGTTTFQNYMTRNTAALAAAGIVAWTPMRTRSGLFSGLIVRPEEVTWEVERRAARSKGLIAMERARLARHGMGQLVISEENLIGSVRNNLREGVFYPLLDLRLERLATVFATQRMRIGLSIRNYEAYWISAMSHAVARGHPVPEPGQIARLVGQSRRWRHLVKEIALAFPGAEILVWPFERFVSQPDAQLRFLTGGRQLPIRTVGARDWHNPGPRAMALREMVSALGACHAERFREATGDGRWMPFCADQRAVLDAAYRRDLDWLRGGADGLAQFIEGTRTRTSSARTDRNVEYSVAGPGADQPDGREDRGRDNEQKRAAI